MQSAVEPKFPAHELFIIHSQEPVDDLLAGGAAAGLHFALVTEAGGLTFRDASDNTALSWAEVEACGSGLVLVLCSDDELSTVLVSKVRGAGGRIVVLANLSRQWRDVADVLAEPADLLRTLTTMHGETVSGPGMRQAIGEHLNEVFDILRKQGLEFCHYRHGFAVRRVEQRMKLAGASDVGRYLEMLRSEPAEARRLAESFFVRVTRFFRDPSAFAAIRERLAELLRERGRLRLWSAGCATGEEAYSLAILALELAEELGVLPTQIRILATDSSEHALDFARYGEYGPHVAAHLGPERLAKYFQATPTGYRVESEVRQLVQFSRHNLLADPPFNEIDLILCRNVLIYLSAAIHEKLLCIFHYSLNPGGYLLLGSSETAGESTPLYSLLDERARLYRRADGPASVDWLPTQLPQRSVPGHHQPVDLGPLVQRILEHEFTPRAAVVAEDGRILWASGDLGPFLAMNRGRFRNQIVQLARKGLKNPLRSALLQARQHRRTMRRPGVRVDGRDGEPSFLVDLTVQPMPDLGDASGLFLVVFQECPERQVITAGEGDDERLSQLEKDLVRVSEELERTVQELESANEELKSSNEELWAMNEELRAANEELEKSRAAIEQKNLQLGRANLDLNHLLTSTELPTIFLDHEQRVLRYTPSATQIYHLIESDLGRPLWQVRDTALDMPELPSAVDQTVLDELELRDGRHLTRKILPYRDVDGQSLGMVVTFSDITDLRRSQTELNLSLVELKAVYDQAPVGLAVLGRDLAVTKKNDRLAQFSPSAELPPTLAEAARELLATGQPVRDLEFALPRESGTRDCLASLYPLRGSTGEIERINLVVQDVSALKQRERDFIVQLRLLDNSQSAVLLCFLDGRYKFVNKAGRRLLGMPASGPVEALRRDHMFSEDEERFQTEILPAVLQEGRWEGDFRWRNLSSGRAVHVWLECVRIDDPQTGRPVKIGSIASDVTRRHEEEAKSRELRETLEELLDTLPWGFLIVDGEARLQAANATARGLLPPEAQGRSLVETVPGWEGSVSQQMTYAALQGHAKEVIHQLPMNQRWYHSFYRPLSDGAAIFFDDVTQTKQDEDRIRELAGLIDNSPDLIAVYDSEWRVRWINPAGLAMAGRTSSQGLTLQDLHPPHVVETLRGTVDELLRQGQWHGETELAVAGGDPVPLSQVLQPLRSADGSLRGFSTIARNISEGKQRERLLQESEVRFRRAILEAPIPVMILAEDGELLAVSESLSQATGYQTGEIGHLSHWLLIAHREQADSVRENFTGLLHGRPMPDFEAPVFTRGGQKRFWRFTGGGAGKLDDGRRYAVVMAVDLTDRLENERALQEGAAFLRRLLDTLSTFVGVCSPDGVLIEVNRASLEVAGLKPEEVLGKPFSETYWWAYDPAVQQQLAEAIERAAAGKPSRYDVDARIGSNQFLTIDFQIVPMRDDEGRITHLVPSATDITERKRILSELENGRERLRALLNSTAEAIYGLDDAGCFTFANPACVRLLGYGSDEDLLGKNAHWLCHHTRPDGTHYPAEECPIWLAFRASQQIHAPRELLFRADGSTFWAEMWAHPLQTHTGQTGCVVTFWDISERLAQEGELSTAKAAAEAASRAKSDFLANMSHEIRTPMAAILGYVDILLRQATDPDNIECLQIIQRNGSHLLEIINDILDLSKIEAGRLHVEQLPVNVQALVAEVISLMEVRAAEKNLDVQVHVEGLLPETISSDPTRLRQVLMNLLGNAIKFTEAGWVKLSVRLLREEQLLEFTVEDTGIGMTPDTIQHLFRPFNQGDTSVTRRFGGTGLGLAISGQLVQLLGGTIQVESAPGQGSVFLFTVATGSLDKVALVEPRGWDDPALNPTPRAPLPSLTGRRIMVADDRRDIRDLVRSYLEEAGAHVDTAGDGSATLKFLETHDVDVLVLDMQMPILDGYATARGLRERGKDLPILALTASAMKGDREACVEAGCDGYLTKPVDRLSLIHQVHALAQRRRTLRALIVEDNPLAGRAVLAMLHTMGCQSELATTAHEALEMVQKTPPDHILIDLGLPDMDGWELLRRFRAMEILQHTRFIAHSGRELAEMSVETSDVQFDSVVQKPATRDALREVLFGAEPPEE
jgi:PAS domain S-box-containing protein